MFISTFHCWPMAGDGCFGVKYVFAVPPFKTRGQQFVYSHHYIFLKRSTGLIIGCFSILSYVTLVFEDDHHLPLKLVLATLILREHTLSVVT